MLKGDITMQTPDINEIDKFVARLQDRQIDWGVLDFQTKVNPKYRRAQMRSSLAGKEYESDMQS